MKNYKNVFIKQIGELKYLTEEQKKLLLNFVSNLSNEQILALMNQKLKPNNFINEAKQVNRQTEEMFAKILNLTKENLNNFIDNQNK